MRTPANEAPSDYIWALVSGLAGDQRRNRVLAMLQAFIDESYDDDIYVMAGWIATATQWAVFADDWQQRLDMRPSIKYLKMNDAMTLDGEFRWWREEARDEKVRLLAKCVAEHAIVAVCSYMPHRQYKLIFDPFPADPAGSPYEFMMDQMIMGIADNQEALGFKEKIDFVFDDNFTEREEIRKNWPLFREVNPEIAHLLGDEPQFKNDLDWKPLQAADMLAWLVRNKQRALAGLSHNADIPEWKIPSSPGMMSLGISEERLRSITGQLDVKVHSTLRWGQWTYMSFVDQDGQIRTVGMAHDDIDRVIRKRKKLMEREWRKKRNG